MSSGAININQLPNSYDNNVSIEAKMTIANLVFDDRIAIYVWIFGLIYKYYMIPTNNFMKIITSQNISFVVK
jgi:hypothetical protein